MKKNFYLVVLLLLTISVLHGQNTHYQLPNNNFEYWGGSGDMPTPVFWYSFSNTACQLSSSTCDMVTAAGGFDNHHKRVTGYNGSGYACQLYAVEIVERTVNGLITTGKSILASENLSDPTNYIYTQRNGSCKWTFSGRPDSISMWARFSFMQNENPKAIMRVHLHGDVDYKDVASHTASTAQTGKIANAYCEMTNPATTPVNGVYKSGWKRFAFKFRYWKPNNQPISTPTLSNTQQPYYALTSVSTNKRGSVGLNDSLALDAIYCIYDKSLATLKINGVSDTIIKKFFNDHEYLTHEKTVNSGAITYNYDNWICYHSEADIPIISATAKSSLILDISVTQATIADPRATITVMHNDSSTYVYTIHFTNVHPAVSLSLDSPNGAYSVCEGDPLTVTASGADNYVWSNNMGTNASIHPTTSGQYTVTASNESGCTAYATAYVTINPIPDVNITGTSIICEGTNTNLTASGAYSYIWSTGATTASINVSDQGTYSVTGTSSAGCSKTSSFSVTVQNAPIITIDGPAVICNGTEEVLTASGSTNYVWNNGSSTGSTLTITTGGIYTVTGSTSGGCAGSASITVQGKPTPSVNISGPYLICGNNPATLVASSNLPGVNFVWSNGATGSTLITSYAGFYTVTASLNGCESSLTHPLSTTSAPAPPTVTPASHCGAGSVTLTASSVSGTSCYWYASNTSQEVLYVGESYTTPSLSVSNTYYVSAQNATGCVSTRVPVTATIHETPAAPIVSSFSQCGEGDITLTATSTNPVQWYSDAQGENIISPTQHVTQNTTYYAAAINENNCRSNLSPMTITINPKPQPPVVTAPDPVCSNSAINVILSATSAIGTNVKWYDSDMNYKGQGNTYQVRNVSSSTTYYATAYNSDCESDPVAVNIIKNPLPAEPTVSCEPLCAPGEVTLIADAGGLSVKWFDANNNFLAEGLTYSTSIATTTIFKASAFDNETLCESSPVSVTALVGQIYHGNININTCEAYVWNGTTYTQSGNYTDTLQTIHGCDSIVTLHLQINESFNLTIDTSVCGQFVWDGQTYTTSQTIIKSFPTDSGCDSTVTIHLTVFNSVNISKTITVCGDQMPFQYGEMTFTSAGTYTFTSTTAEGCDSTITLTLIVNPQPSLPNISPSSITHCGEDYISVNASSGANGTICRWYISETDAEPFMTSNSFQYSFDESTTIYASSYNANTGCESARTPMHITIYPIPTEPEVSPVTRCGTGSVTFNAVIDETANTCRWYSNQYTNTPIYVGLDFTRTIVASSTFYVQSYNSSTGCKSERVPAVATVNIPPTKPQTSPVSNCGPLTTDLANYVSSSSMLYRWYDQNGDFLTESNHYNTTVNETNTFYVSFFNEFTTCESELSPLTVTINENYAPQDIYDTTCQNSLYQNYNIDQIFVTPGEININVNTLSSTGCDSIVTLHLFVRPQITNEISINTCGQYIWGDSIYTETGIYTKTFTAANGCDSIVTLNLTITPTDQMHVYAVACEQYEWYGTTYTQSGTYDQIYTNMFGCDSIITLHLTIHPAYHQDLIVSALEEYTLNHETYYESGDYIQQYTTVNGCDSSINLHLTIYQSQDAVIQDEVCAGTPYTLNGFDTIFTEAGEYTLTHHDTDIHGYDSITTLLLTVNPVFNTVIEQSICHNDSYDFFGQTISESGTYTNNLQSTAGCDSIITLQLTVFPEQIDTIIAHTCYGVSYHDEEFDIYHPTESGYYFHYDYDMHDCDSITVLHLLVNQPAETTLNATLCIGETYTENGFEVTATEPGEFTFVQNLSTINGCDSTVFLYLTVNLPDTIDTVVNVCDIDLPFLWDNNEYFSYSEAGDYDIHIQATQGCDRLIHLHLQVSTSFEKDTTVNVCAGALPYVFCEGYSFNEPGNYTVNLQSVNGCDSVWNLQLFVIPNTEHDASVTICDNEFPFTYLNETFTAPGYYDITETDIDNCVTITHLTLNVNPTYHGFDTVTVCEETLPFIYGTTPLTSSGEYDIHLNATTTCDSMITVLFTVLPSTHGSEAVEQYVCPGEYPVSFGGNLFEEAGTYEVAFPREGLCDSLVTFILHEYPAYMFNEEYIVSSLDLPYSWHGVDISQSGVFFDSLTSAQGCDSIYRLNFIVYEAQIIESDPIFLCEGETAEWRNMTLSQSGTYRDTITNDVIGSYEIYQVSVTVYPTYLFEDTVTVCSSSLPYIWHDLVINEAGAREIFFQTAETFCDSIYRLILYVNPSYHVSESATVCENELPFEWRSRLLTESGDYHDTLTTVNGCDSIFSINFVVNPAVNSLLVDTACANELPYLWRGHQLTSAGFYFDTIPNAFGCQDIFGLQLTISQSSDTTIQDVICAGETYTLNGFNIPTDHPSILYEQRNTVNSQGCDSTIFIMLEVLPSYLIETDGQTCNNVPFEWRGRDYNFEGTYYDSLVTVSGCDSIFVLNLIVNPTYDIYVNDTAIREHEYTYDGFVITPEDSGTIYHEIQHYTIYGCDSIVHLTLYVAYNEGIDEVTLPSFSFYPNPTSAQVNIQGEQMRKVEVFSIDGKLFYHAKAESPEFTQIDVTSFPTGHYLVRITLDNGQTVTRKIIVNRK
ncbi:MAG: T9SS type A sorting domain-containing protein [Bacteroidales bacterium]|nr:T9SS type A sorting domain-containing protein [Bacteroidales bacterium]